MTVKRSRPGHSEVRKSNEVGPDYPEENFRNPYNAGVDRQRGSETSKTLLSPTDTTAGPSGDDSLNHDYDSYWEGK
jgi:hypothetical protein